MKRSSTFMACGRLVCFLMLTVPAQIFAQNLVMVAGGGAEGDQGDTGSWSFTLYSRLVANGDRTGDGIVRVAILAEEIPTQPAEASWLPDYFQWIGTTLGETVIARNYEVGSRSHANDATVVGAVADADVVFIKGGDQGRYYDLWNDTLLETHIRTVAERGGALGGTSAGAMSMAAFAFSGGRDMISEDVLADAQTPFLDDASQPGTSGIHTDFLSFVANAVIETHFTQRGRLGRMAGVLARAGDDSGNNNLTAIGLELNTGLVISNGIAEVLGVGAVTFLHSSAATTRIRTAGKPLHFTELVLDRLTEGWFYNLNSQSPVISGAPGQGISPQLSMAGNSGALILNGSSEDDKQKFAHYGTYYPADYARVAGGATPYVRDCVGFTDAGNSNNRMDKHETLFRLLYDQPADLGVLVYDSGTITRENGADVLNFGADMASMIVDTATATHKGLSPYPSNWATSGGALRAAAFVNARLHIMGETAVTGQGYNSTTHAVVAADTGEPGGNGLQEQEPNDSRGGAQNLDEETWPLSLDGTIDDASDRDYFLITLSSNQRLEAALAVPAGVDYDLYLFDNRGRTLTRSVNDGSGVAEALGYTNTSRKRKTYYVQIESYSGSSSTQSYTLSLSR